MLSFATCYHHPEGLWEWHACIHIAVSGCTLTIPFPLHTHSSQSSPLLSQACCRLPKYLSHSCRHLSAQQLERLPSTPSLSTPITYTLALKDGARKRRIKPLPYHCRVSLFQSVGCVCFHPWVVCALMSNKILDKWCAWGMKMSHQESNAQGT